MKKTKNFFNVPWKRVATAGAAATLLATTPVAAQTYGGPYSGSGYGSDSPTRCVHERDGFGDRIGDRARRDVVDGIGDAARDAVRGDGIGQDILRGVIGETQRGVRARERDRVRERRDERAADYGACRAAASLDASSMRELAGAWNRTLRQAGSSCRVDVDRTGRDGATFTFSRTCSGSTIQSVRSGRYPG